MLFQLAAMSLLAQPPVPAEPPQLQELTRQVDVAVREHRSSDAVRMLDKALKASPQWRKGWWLLGSILYDLDDYATARPALERLIRLDPKSGAPWALLGLCEFELRDYGLALEHLQRGDAFGIPAPLDVDVVRYHEALLLMLAERFDPAQVILDHLTQKGLDTEEIVLTQGMIALRIPALPVSLNRIASEERIDFIRRVGRAQHLISQQKPREAVTVYRELLKDGPKIANLHLSFSVVLLQIKERQEAEAEMRTELKLYPESVEARFQLCGLLEDDAPRDALSFAEQAAALDPKSFKAHFLLGKMLFKVEKFAESAKELEMSRDLDPTSSAVRFALVRTYKSLGREADAAREAAIFRRLRSAEDQFRTTGRVSPSFFESDPSADKPASQSPADSGPKGPKTRAAH
ncbi:MAG: tetratricopeptide repeat protein [Bryobacteraceae bacterium]|nr:tetratricopeptide repeat protein [Bryobacteraceae bacterium]